MVKLIIVVGFLSAHAMAGNLSDLVGGGGGSSSAPVVGNNTYYTVGGNPNFCRSSALNTRGGYTNSNVNNGSPCDTGKHCYNGACTTIASVPACSSSSAIGDLCSGGAIYAGQYAGNDYMITPSNCVDTTCSTIVNGTAVVQDTLQLKWANGTGTSASNVSTGANSTTNGLSNTSTLANNYTDTDAAKFCYNLDFGGHNDWFLPSSAEIVGVLAPNRILFRMETGVYYQSSTEMGTTTNEAVNNTSVASAAKSASYLVRCVRKF